MENKPDSNEQGESMDVDQAPQTFMSFQVKEDMTIAPVTRRTLNSEERSSFESSISAGITPTNLYLTQMKNAKFAPRKSGRTLPDYDDDKSSNADDLFIIGTDWIIFNK